MHARARYLQGESPCRSLSRLRIPVVKDCVVHAALKLLLAMMAVFKQVSRCPAVVSPLPLFFAFQIIRPVLHHLTSLR